MANWDDVRRLALGLPETDEHHSHGDALAWRVKQKASGAVDRISVEELEVGDRRLAGPRTQPAGKGVPGREHVTPASPVARMSGLLAGVGVPA
jgi:hypothetical protein